VVVTGAATGLGLESAKQLAARGATVVLGARDAGKMRHACDTIRASYPAARLHSLRLDLSDLDSVREFADEVRRLPEVSGGAGAGGVVTATVARSGGGGSKPTTSGGGVDAGSSNGAGVYCLMLNAGVMALPKRAAYPLGAAANASSPEDQADLQFLTNHVGHHLLARLLEPELKRAGELARRNGSAGGGGNGSTAPRDCARAVFLSSCAHFTTYTASQGGPVRIPNFGGPDKYEPWLAYGQSKLCNLLDAREFARRWRDEDAPCVAVACHPGVIVATDLFRHMPIRWEPLRAALALLFRPFLKNIPQGAATQTFLATAPITGDGRGVKNGAYYADVNISPSSPASADDVLGRKLWDVTEAMVGGGGGGLAAV
jgi:NAD(P)-dependent dehydrogenase (short-subunit alcohol dehydrogenase family)